MKEHCRLYFWVPEGEAPSGQPTGRRRYDFGVNNSNAADNSASAADK